MVTTVVQVHLAKTSSSASIISSCCLGLIREERSPSSSFGIGEKIGDYHNKEPLKTQYRDMSGEKERSGESL